MPLGPSHKGSQAWSQVHPTPNPGFGTQQALSVVLRPGCSTFIISVVGQSKFVCSAGRLAKLGLLWGALRNAYSQWEGEKKKISSNPFFSFSLT